jgi:ectoine hydroxylase-related dioxygenase (phytanoyl-CoA dioxygenase family)
MGKKFVMGLPKNMIPDWINKRSKNLGFVNLCALVRPEFRDMTYFHGIDYHMDIVDHKNRIGDFITLYIYLGDVTANMSPLHIIPRSHIFGGTTVPHDLKSLGGNKILYSDRRGKSEEFNSKMLTGTTGSVFFWSPYNLHGTMPTNITNTPRVSLRYLIERGKSTEECIIDKFLKTIDAPLSMKITMDEEVKRGYGVGSRLLKPREQLP